MSTTMEAIEPVETERAAFEQWARKQWAAMTTEQRREVEDQARSIVDDRWHDDLHVEQWSAEELLKWSHAVASVVRPLAAVVGRRTAAEWEREYGVPIPALMRASLADLDKGQVVRRLWWRWIEKQVRSAMVGRSEAAIEDEIERRESAHEDFEVDIEDGELNHVVKKLHA